MSRPSAYRPFSTVLIANRGEIAVRIARACRDAGLRSIAVYSDSDRSALHTKVADEAYALGGTTAAQSYLVVDKLLDIAQRSGADAIHPGYGFLSEQADFAQAVMDAGMVWIGPPPRAIEQLGDKVSARHIAQRAGAPLVAGTKDPVKGSDEVLEFAKREGLPIAIKAAFGGGGRGLKVARELAEVRELYDSAVREAVSAFGRGECFVERFLDSPRHVETQCLADSHGNVQVVSTRDCSLQRRHQKLVEEAPAPFLTDNQNTQLVEASRAILREADYVGAGTCEFLVGKDGTISFLEVNTRLQVEHPVTEEITGVDLVREQFRIAAGERISEETPVSRGHSFEFRINGEDAGRGFLPSPGPIKVFEAPSGPGVRVDSGVRAGDEISGHFDSMLAKLIVTGATRREALERSRRALDEFRIDGLPTVMPFHRLVVDDPDFAPQKDDEPFRVHTRWIETEWTGEVTPAPLPVPGEEDEGRENVVVEVDGRRVEVSLPASLRAPRTPSAQRRRRTQRGQTGPAAASGNAVTAPMQGTIVKVVAEEGQSVADGDLLVVLEAMKMEQPILAHRSGVVKNLDAEIGATVSAGAVLCELDD
ncbi:acetyl/propionyl/methylcrotonyl-CoA carboxylase subunit alpha [Helcobacillus massiliensis]|uniref:biotin carboxylase n=1 Tax=Helcobacillus massiliensis TaxID=521392 RepID=A0A839QVA6_9MICO|nr:biotin carboxylase N-terminal domain-containing protein [Helcobacillus massiliensis]MBB3021941.1 acetyl-CoA/propionyl-CoA carboxylase biotin carboxyl carrier protein [Helcobacillus massiliensis]